MRWQIKVTSEIGRLRTVLLGRVDNFKLYEPINAQQRHFYANDPPRLEVLKQQQAAFVEVLERHGVQIVWAAVREDSPAQVYTRDVAFSLDDTLVVCAMREPVRQREPEALEPLLAEVEGSIERVEAGFLEGGDVILDGRWLYVGLSDRTDPAGLSWLDRRFGDRFEIMPVPMKPGFLHLDVVFNRAGRDTALIHAPALTAEALSLLESRYHLIEVDAEEQFRDAVNVFSLSPGEVVADLRNARVNALLRERGLNVIELDFSEIMKMGGAFRCATCPLERDPL
ncbi:MAG: hypothetical protein JSV66_09715 [Trueperaceae bacterium]|nr:MAG: hypothetical protein JSV66_09715 [Trueperaceae bacterium]